MRKVFKALVLILAAVFCFQAGLIFAAAEDVGTSEDWELIDTISLDVVSTYAQEILGGPSGRLWRPPGAGGVYHRKVDV